MFFGTLLIVVEGAQTPAGSAPAPRKAKRLERKSTALFNRAIFKSINLSNRLKP